MSLYTFSLLLTVGYLLYYYRYILTIHFCHKLCPLGLLQDMFVDLENTDSDEIIHLLQDVEADRGPRVVC